MVIGNSAWSLHREFRAGKVTALTFPRICVEKFGIKHVEMVGSYLLGTDAASLATFRKAMDEVGAIPTLIPVDNDFSMVSETERAAQVEFVNNWLEAAAELGWPLIRVNAGWRSQTDAAFDRVVECIKACLPTAERVGVDMTIENHGGMSANPDLVVRLIEKVGSSRFGTCPDFGNLATDDRYIGMEKLFPSAKHVHAKSYNFDEQGWETQIDYKRIFQIIKKSGYDGVLSIEYEGEDDQYEGVLKTKALIERLL